MVIAALKNVHSGSQICAQSCFPLSKSGGLFESKNNIISIIIILMITITKERADDDAITDSKTKPKEPVRP
jgi:hypothetical protein